MFNEQDLPPPILIKQGAEAKIYQLTYLGMKTILKERCNKAYRHPHLDQKINSRRILLEARIIAKASKVGIDVPMLYYVSPQKNSIFMEFVEGQTVKDYLMSCCVFNCDSVMICGEKIGCLLWKMHSANIIHGDLTTSNMILKNDNSSIVLIDFGLASISSMDEDKAVDLYVLERAIQSTHPMHTDLFKQILLFYSSTPQNDRENSSRKIIHKLNEVRLRGRKKSMMSSSNDPWHLSETNKDALDCRISAHYQHLIDDPFCLLFSNKKIDKKRPITNIGTFVRTTIIDKVVESFFMANSRHQSRYQIISLGAGFDTRYFRLYSKYSNLMLPHCYYELDFEHVIKEKQQILYQNQIKTDPFLRLIPFDLSQKPICSRLSALFDPLVETLIIAECIFPYLEDGGDEILQYFSTFNRCKLISFDLIEPFDGFGRIMLKNIQEHLNVSVPGTLKYPSIEAIKNRLENTLLGKNIDCYSLYEAWNERLGAGEKEKISTICGRLDEYEELVIVFNHYVFSETEFKNCRNRNN